MALTKEQREALPASDFAVPGKRALPIHDRDHVKMAWSQLDHTKGLTDTERAEAKRRILARAKDLGIDTSKWEAHDKARMDMQPASEHDGGELHAMSFGVSLEAMSLAVPDVDDHPNRVPFSGVMTRIDEPSDNPVGGAMGKLVFIPRGVAEAALPSLLGMGVDYTPGLDGHNPQKKIGVITGATIDGNAIHIEGFLYGSDFPAVVAEIQANKSQLGFSYEAQAAVADWNSNPVEVTRCVFTGAAILLKDKAAYTTTSIEASASEPEISDMDIQELMAAVKQLTEQNTAMAAKLEKIEASTGNLQASNVLHKVKPHADKIRACADGLEAEGMGGHERQGHVAVLRRMADKMEAEAVLGKLPHLWRDHDWLDAAAEKPTAEVEALKSQLAEMKAKLDAAAFNAAAAPQRQTSADPAAKPALQAAAATDLKAEDAKLAAAGASIKSRLTAITLARMQPAA